MLFWFNLFYLYCTNYQFELSVPLIRVPHRTETSLDTNISLLCKVASAPSWFISILQKFTYLVFNCSTHLVSWKFGWSFELFSVLPEVLEFGTTRHRWAAGVGTFLANGPVDQIDSVNRTSLLLWTLYYS